MRTEHLQALLTVAQTGSINQASKLLHINQQQLSKIIQHLEADLGCPIFQRSHKGVTPTPAGQDILATAEAIIQQLDALRLRLAPEPAPAIQGTLTIHATTNVWPSSLTYTVLDAFTSAYPSVFINLDEQPPLPTIEAILEHPDHLGIIVKEKTQIGLPLSLPEELTFIPLYQHKIVVLAGRDSDYAKAHRSTSLRALLKEPSVVYRPDMNSPAAIDNLFAPLGGIDAKYSVSNLTTFHNLLQKGKAIAVGVEKSPSYLEQNHLVSIAIRDNIVTEIGFLLHQKHQNDPLINAFISFYLEYMQCKG